MISRMSILLYGLKVKAPDRNRTGGLVLTKDVLYRLSYRGKNIKLKYIYLIYLCQALFYNGMNGMDLEP